MNALIGALCCPMADNAGTSGVLTIDVENGLKDYQLSTNNGAHGRVLLRGSALAVQEQLRAINATLRAADQADCEESDLLLRAPSRSEEGPTLRVVDSPSMNADLSPNICARWKQSIYAVDVLIVVSDYLSFGSSDEGELWRQLADELANIGAENIVLLINKYDQATVDEGDEEGHRERTKLERIEYVQKATSGRIVLKPDQVFLRCARNAVIARTIQNFPDGKKLEDEQYKELLGLVNRVFYPNKQRQFSSAGELRSAEDWDEVYEASGFAEIDRFLQAKAEVATLAHLHKFVTLARTSANRISSTSTTSYRQLAESEASAQTVIQNIASSKSIVETYFNDEAREEDELYQHQLRAAISYLHEQLRVDLHDASFDQLMLTLPEETLLGGEDADNTQLVDMLRTLREMAQTRLAVESASFRERLHSISQKRSELMRRFLADVKQIFDAHRVVIPNGILAPDALERSASDAEAVSAFIDQSFAWLEGFLSLDTSQLVSQAVRTLRLKYAPDSVLDVAVDFTQDPRGNGRVSGSWILEGQTCKLRHGSQLVVSFEVKTEFVGQPFVLEVQHLTSDAGETSRSAVTVKVNDTAIRTAFDPRAAYEVNGNKIGLWYYVTDRWLVSPDLIKEGANAVTFEYAEGTALYWLKRLNVKATRPNAPKQVLRREDIVSTFVATALEHLDLKDNQRASLNDKIANTAPLAVQRVAFNRCMELLLDLTRAAEQGGDFVKETRATLSKIVGQCADVLRISTGVVGELTQIGAASSSRWDEPFASSRNMQ